MDSGFSWELDAQIGRQSTSQPPRQRDTRLPAGLRVLDVARTGDRQEGMDASYKLEHMELFDNAGLPWPAPRAALDFCQHLDQRAFEVLVYVHNTWPYELKEEVPVPQFIDVNFSLKRLAPNGGGGRNPWRHDRLPTLTGSGIYILRTGRLSELAKGDVGAIFAGRQVEVELRQLDGLELLQIIGYDITYMDINTLPSHSLATSLAGNAFSAFSVAPCLLALFSVVEPDAVWQSVPPPTRQIGADAAVEADSDLSD